MKRRGKDGEVLLSIQLNWRELIIIACDAEKRAEKLRRLLAGRVEVRDIPVHMRRVWRANVINGWEQQREQELALATKCRHAAGKIDFHNREFDGDGIVIQPMLSRISR